jgi:hypothetical protein
MPSSHSQISPMWRIIILYVFDQKGYTVLTFKNAVRVALHLAPDNQRLGSQTNPSVHLLAGERFHVCVSATSFRRPLP